MKKIKHIVLVVYNIIRFKVKHFLYKGLQIKGFVLVSPRATLELDKESRLSIEPKFMMESSSYLGVRANAEVNIGKTVYINRNCVIVSHEKIQIDDGVQIDPNVCIYDHDHDLKNRGNIVAKPIHIKKNVWISAGVTILKGVTIGENAVIAAGCVVTSDVPDNVILTQKRSNQLKHLV